jgi:hypothetical protein
LQRQRKLCRAEGPSCVSFSAFFSCSSHDGEFPIQVWFHCTKIGTHACRERSKIKDQRKEREAVQNPPLAEASSLM